MNGTADNGTERESPPSFLKQFARKRSVVEERCELCSAVLAPMHQHLLEPTKHQIVCSCDACAILFSGQAGARYLRVPRRIRSLSDFQMLDLQWEALMIPIELAFFYRDSASGKMMAMYPSPAGAIESQLSLEAWEEIAAAHPALRTMEPDVETFLVNRVTKPHEYYIVPIDECFRLVGLIRMHWRGLSGGGEVWKEIARFFTDLKARSTDVKELPDA
ncbi:MAG: DUF5947 family protein [Acidobacteriota bacterium]|nr:DUF5947 family protein [Acidobacteriota bacterium]